MSKRHTLSRTLPYSRLYSAILTTLQTSKKAPMVLAVGTLLQFSSAFADTTIDTDQSAQPSVTLDPIVVVANQTPKAISDIPATVWYIDEYKVDEAARTGKRLGDFIAQEVPSLDLGSGGRTSAGQNLRGRSMQVMIDGVSLNSSRAISRYLDSISMENIESIEVLSGASAVYGGGATGGIINIKTKKAQAGEPQITTSIQATSGFQDEDDISYKGHASIGGGTETIKSKLAVTYEQTGSFFDGSGKMLVPDTTQGSLQDNETIDILASTQLQIDEKQTLDLSAQYYNSEQDTDYGIQYDLTTRPFGAEISDGFESDRQASTERQQYNANYHNTELFGHEVYAQLSHRTEELSFIPFIYGTYFAASEQSTDVTSARVALSKDWTDKLKLTYGIDGYQDKLDSNKMIFSQGTSIATGGLVNDEFAIVGRYPGTEVNSIAGFIQGDYELTDKLSATAGMRYQHLNNKIDDFVSSTVQTDIALGNATGGDAIPGGSTDYNVNLFNLGLNYKPTSNLRYFANFSQGFELPDPAKFYGQGIYAKNAANYYELVNGSNVSGTELDGIKTDSYELGTSFNHNNLTGQLTGYYSLSDGSIDYDRSTLLITQSDNKKRVYGVEAKGDYAINDNVSIGVLAHWVKSETQVDGSYEDTVVTDTSPAKYALWTRWEDDNQALKLQANMMRDVSGYDSSSDSTQELDGYTTVDLDYTYFLPSGEFSLGVQNLLDKDYTTVWGQQAQIYYGSYAPASAFDYKGLGRTYTVGYTHRF
ncbi:TonB-dependent receptor [Psychrobacter fozii]|uniref:Iron complex outermembrane receptor protein n=1 Tax=Psychrobacter fozii TaxID=198480 RepID=A0A2V4VLR4_9GAMM|nr:TonB-dependent receptor [Psychrobacter fozii]PYE39815.1 iron complex outermembrane receptor protein [Psychrobacter fozii]